MERNNGEMRYNDYVKENLVNDIEAVTNIANAAAEDIRKKFDIYFSHERDMIIAIFSVTFRNYVKKLRDRSRQGYAHFKINIAKRLEIGYDNAENDEYEKNGGFMFYVKHLYFHSTDDDVSDRYGKDTIQLCTEWNSANVISSSDDPIIKEVCMDSVNDLKKLDISADNPEVITPIFISVYEAIIGYMKITKAELGEFEHTINFASLFDVSIRDSADDDDDIIVFTPSIEFKLELKSDEAASSKYD